MTTFGIDVSWRQASIDLSVVTGATNLFLMAKATEGQGWQDSNYDRFRDSAEDNGLLFAAYHFLRGDSDPRLQADNVKEVVGDSGVPVIIDIERTTGTVQPKMSTVRAFKSAAEALGIKVSRLLYLPEWYWDEIGRPDTSGWDLWQSDYGSNDGLYRGDDSPQWNSHGRVASVLQFTSQGRLAGYNGLLDRDAFRGTRAELAQKGWFIDYSQETSVTKEQLQDAVRTTPIQIDAAGNTLPLWRVLRQVLNRPDPSFPASATPDAIAQAVVAALPVATTGITPEDVRSALKDVLTHGVSAT